MKQRVLLIIFILLVFSTFIGSFSIAEGDFEPFDVRATDKISVRDDAFGNVIGNLNKNAIVNVIGTKDADGITWYEITYNDSQAYICSLYTSLNLEAVAEFDVRTICPTNVTNKENGTVIGSLDDNIIKTVYGQRKDVNGVIWYRVSINEEYAYINSNRVSNDLTLFQTFDVRMTDKLYYRDDVYGNILGSFNKNSIKKVYDLTQDQHGVDWYRILHNENLVYIYSLYTSDNLDPVDNYNIRIISPTQVKNDVLGDNVGNLETNTVKTVYGTKKDRFGGIWYRVWFNESDGYIDANKTSDDLTPFNTFEVRLTDNVYSRDDISGNKADLLYKNTIKTVYGKKTDNNGVDWYKIWHNNRYSYVYSLYTSEDLEAVNDFKVVMVNSTSVRDDVWGNIVDTLSKYEVKTVYGIRLDRDANIWYRIWTENGSRFIRKSNTSKNISEYTINFRVTDNIYTRDAIWGNKLDLVAKNSIKTIYGIKRDNNDSIWYKVWHNNRYSYIYINYTSDDLNPVNNFKVAITDVTDIRDDVWGSKIGKLFKYNQKTVYGIRKDRSGRRWYKIWHSGKYAFIKAYNTTKDINSFKKNVRITDNVYLRDGIWGEKQELIHKNTIKTVYGLVNDSNGQDWYKVWNNGKYSYLYSNYTSNNLLSSYNFNIVAEKTILVRDSVWGNVVGSVPEDAIKTVYGIRRDRAGRTWYRIWYNNTSGYILATRDYARVAYDDRVNTVIKILVDGHSLYNDPNGEVVSTVGKGNIFKVLSTIYSGDSTWYKVNYNSGVVYIKGNKNYNIVYKYEVSVPIEKRRSAMVVDNTLTFRDSPKGNILDILKMGDKVDYISSKDDTNGHPWYKVLSGSKVGYIYSGIKYAVLVDKKGLLTPKHFPGKLDISIYPNLDVYVINQSLKVYLQADSIQEPIYYAQYWNGSYWETYAQSDPMAHRNPRIYTLKAPMIKFKAVNRYNPNEYVENVVAFDTVDKGVKIRGIESGIFKKKKIKFYVTSNNLNSPMYQVSISRNNKTTIISDFSSKKYYEWEPDEYGDYLLTVKALDANGDNSVQMLDSVNIVVSEDRKVGFYTNIDNRSYMNAPIDFKAFSNDEFNEYKLSYRLDGSQKTVIEGYTKNKSFTYMPEYEGNYEFILEARNKLGEVVEYKKDVLVKRLSSEIDFNREYTENYYDSRFGYFPDITVAHITEGSYSSAVDWLTKKQSRVSSHFVISRGGSVTQLLDIGRSAWTNGTRYELDRDLSYYDSKSSTVVQRKANANIYSVTIEHEGVYNVTHGELTYSQKQATIKVIEYVRSELRRLYNKLLPFNKNNFLGHSHFNPQDKPNCPGELYPFKSIIKAINRP